MMYINVAMFFSKFKSFLRDQILNRQFHCILRTKFPCNISHDLFVPSLFLILLCITFDILFACLIFFILRTAR